MVECFIERTKQKLVRGHEQQKVSVRSNDSCCGPEKRLVVLDVLENVHGNERISFGRRFDLVDVRLNRAHPIASEKFALEGGKNISRGLDAEQALYTRRIDHEFRERPDSRADLDDLAPEKRREAIDNPTVIISSAGNRFELSTGILKGRRCFHCESVAETAGAELTLGAADAFGDPLFFVLFRPVRVEVGD